MLSFFVLALFTVCRATANDCGCSSAGLERENIFECVARERQYSHFVEEAYEVTTRDLRSSDADLMLRYAKYLKVKDHDADMYWSKIRAALHQKRVDEVDPTCSCLDAMTTCLDVDCGRQSLDDICDWSSRRLFRFCSACSGHRLSLDAFQSAIGIRRMLETYEPAIVAYLLNHVEFVTAVDFEYDYTTGTQYVSITLADGVVEPTLALNHIAYYLSQMFDVYPGTITYGIETSMKRQMDYRVLLNIVDEVQIIRDMDSASSATVVGLFSVVALALRMLL